MNEEIDDIGGGLKLIRHRDQFALGTDAVLLSKFVALSTKDRVIDLGAGPGSIPLLLVSRCQPKEIVALELQPELAELCRRSIALNKLEHKIRVIVGDIRNSRSLFPPGSFDLVICNPPYTPVGGSIASPKLPIARARHELTCTLADIAVASAWLARFGGRIAMVHRPQRLGDIFMHFRKNKLEPKRIQFVHPRPGREANIVMIEAKKGGRPGLRVLPPLTLRGDDSNNG